MSLNFAHRGFSASYPENTMLAYQKAVEIGAQGIEMDVRFTRDRKVIISHDGKLERMAGKPGHVRDYDLSELRTFNFCGMHPEAGFTPIVTFEEYLDYIRTTDIITNVEIKSNADNFLAIEDACVDLIRRFHLEERIIFSSFNHDSMIYCKRIAPEIRTGLLFYGEFSREFAHLSFADYAKLCCADYLHPHHTSMTPEDVAQAQEDGIGVNVWTVDDPDIMRRYIAVGTHGIITNHPEILHGILGE